MKNIFTKHPHSVGETYWEHLWFASKFGASLLVAGLACITHAIFPFLFPKTASNILLNQVQEFITRMPQIEHRVDNLCTLIQKKKEENKNPK